MPYCIYKITNKINSKIYIGYHKVGNNLDDGYMGSGKLIKRALALHGKENFKKEILKIFHCSKDAELYEEFLVDYNFIMRDDTYNISLGGNVTALFGDKNGFYGKKHNKETIQRIQKKRQRTINDRGYFRKNDWHCYVDHHECYNFSQIKNILGLSFRKTIKFFVENKDYCGFLDLNVQEKVEKTYLKIIEHEIYQRKLTSELCSLRFKSIPKSEQHKKRIGQANKGRYQWWMNKINKNPEKIRKSAEKHRGMKRTEETKENISNSIKKMYDDGHENPIKNKKCYYDPITEKIGFYKEDQQPTGWIKGNPKTKKKVYYNPSTMECKRFKEGEQPDGWALGQPNNVRTKKKYKTTEPINELPI